MFNSPDGYRRNPEDVEPVLARDPDEYLDDDYWDREAEL